MVALAAVERAAALDAELSKGGGDATPIDPVVLAMIDARNGFNEQSRLAMLWTVRHRWASMARFV